MMAQFRNMVKLELCNIYGLNMFRFSKDRRARKKSILMMAAAGIIISIIFLYVGGLSYGLARIGMEGVIPAYLMTLSSLFTFFFGLLKAGNVIFRKNGYDILYSLPISQAAIVFSRFLRMYVENLLFAFILLLPGLVVYAWSARPDAAFYLCGMISLLAVPFVPAAGAAFLGALVTGISSRMRHKGLVAAGLSILAFFAAMFGISGISALEGEPDIERIAEMASAILGTLGKIYPPAVWLGTAAVNGAILQCLLYAGLFLAAFAAVAAIVSARFQSICRYLYSTSARHNYQMGELKKESILISLYRREWKRYFSSSIYVMNTVIGPIMGTVLSGVLLFAGVGTIKESLSDLLDINALVPLVLAGIFCFMTTTSTSISMEGKEWWIVKSLPLSAKSILDAKILMNLVLMLPFYLVSEVLLMLALKPGIPDMLWMLFIPAAIGLFSCVYGITINLHFPVLEWESEVAVIKQSASALIGGIGGLLVAVLCMVGTALVPNGYSNIWKILSFIIILAITAFLYRKNNRVDLQGIGT